MRRGSLLPPSPLTSPPPLLPPTDRASPARPSRHAAEVGGGRRAQLYVRAHPSGGCQRRWRRRQGAVRFRRRSRGGWGMVKYNPSALLPLPPPSRTVDTTPLPSHHPTPYPHLPPTHTFSLKTFTAQRIYAYPLALTTSARHLLVLHHPPPPPNRYKTHARPAAGTRHTRARAHSNAHTYTHTHTHTNTYTYTHIPTHTTNTHIRIRTHVTHTRMRVHTTRFLYRTQRWWRLVSVRHAAPLSETVACASLQAILY